MKKPGDVSLLGKILMWSVLSLLAVYYGLIIVVTAMAILGKA
jgi:hypothetical protein